MSTLVSGDREYAPDPSTPRERFRFSRDVEGGKLALLVTRDDGASWKSIAAEPPSNAGEGWIPTVGPGGTIKWVSPMAALSSAQKNISDDDARNLMWVDFSYPGEVLKDKLFGVFEVPAGRLFSAYGVQITCFASPTTSTVNVILKNATSGVLHNSTKTFLSSGQIYTSSIFPSEVPMPTLHKFQFFITYDGVDVFPGSYVVCRLLVKNIT